MPVLWQLQLSHYNERIRWALDYKRVPHIRRSLLPGPHIGKAQRLTGDTATTPVLTLDGSSIDDSTRIIAAIEQHWPQPPLYPEDPTLRREALARRPGGQWVTDAYRRHRGRSAALAAAEAARIAPIDDLAHGTASTTEVVSITQAAKVERGGPLW